MNKESLLKTLYVAETDINEFYPIAKHNTDLTNRLDRLQNISSSEELRLGETKTKAIMYIALTLVCLVLSIMDFMLSFLFIFAFISGLLFSVAKIYMIFKIKNKEIPNTLRMIAETNAAIRQSNSLMDRKLRELVGLQIWRTMMPQECLNPAYARKFISYIETDQATSLPDARKLFEELLHRERMEDLVSKQISAIRAGNAQIIAAANRAADAANAAASATRNLNQTANYIRSK